jgi:NhaP-type Na+/H+ or K+/H+ antiporter
MYFSDSTLALLLGILMSSNALGWLDVTSWWGNQELLIEEVARLSLAIGLMGVALRLPKGYVPQHWKPLTVVLGLVMPLMWLSSGLLVWLLLDLPFWVAMLIGAVVTPTDPVVSTDIVTGVVAEENIPGRLRHLISSESGLNDGLGYPVVFLPILLMTRSPGEALSHWLQLGWQGLLLAIAVLLLRRLPAMLALRALIKPLHGFSDALFVGWFGPIGVAALYYAHLSVRLTGNHEIWVVSSLLIFVSILVYSISATPLSLVYGKRFGEQ